MKNKKSFFYRWRYWFNGILLILPCWFLYQQLNPVFPDPWEKKQLGPFTVQPMPYNLEGPYTYDGKRYKDFSLTFCEGCVEKIRYAYVSVAPEPIEIPADDTGAIHGNNYGQEVHAPYPDQLQADDKLWVTVQDWSGNLYHASWDIE